MDLNEMLVFVEVVRAGSFTNAARALNLPKSSVSRRVASLEDRLRVQLLRRTTRKLSLTDVGEDYYRACDAILGEVEAAEQRVAEMQANPCGRLRVTAPPTFAFLGSVVADYLGRYPEVRVELICTERVVDLVAEGFDIAVRAGRLLDSTLIARKVGTVSRFLVATADYLERHGAPRTPEELREHDTIVFGGGREGDVWTLRSGRKTIEIRPAPRLVTDDYELLLEATRSGLGVALLPNYVCQDAVENESLVRVLPAWSSPEIPIHAVYPAARQPTMKVTAFLDLLRDRFAARRASPGGVATRRSGGR